MAQVRDGGRFKSPRRPLSGAIIGLYGMRAAVGRASVVAMMARDVVPVIGLRKQRVASAVANDDGGSARRGRLGRITRISRPCIIGQPSRCDQSVPDFDTRRLVSQHAKKQTFQSALASKNPYSSQFPEDT